MSIQKVFQTLRSGMLSKKLMRRLQQKTAPFLHAENLDRLAEIYGTDKWGSHWYTKHYQTHFFPMREMRLNVLEIGIGGYDATAVGGASLRMWKHFFPNSLIYGIDIHDKSKIEQDRIKTFQGDQSDVAFLKSLATSIGRLDIVIDDGSHVNCDVITAFETLFPLLSDGGIYVVEDTQTSYWPNFGGDSEKLSSPHTTMGFFKALIDGLNYKEFDGRNSEPSYFDTHIVSMHFYHNLVFIYKGDNSIS